MEIGEKMVRITTLLCDVCGAEIPETRTMEHNEAADTMWGTFSYHSGVVVHNSCDLCETCAKRVKEFIYKMEGRG